MLIVCLHQISHEDRMLVRHNAMLLLQQETCLTMLTEALKLILLQKYILIDIICHYPLK